MKVVVIAVGGLLALGGAGYAGLCYMVGAEFVQGYQQKLAEQGQTGQVEHGVFATKVTSTIGLGSAPGKLEVVTEVDHMVMPDRWLKAETVMKPDQQTAQMAKMFFAKSPEVRITTIAHMDDTKTVEGSIPPIASKPNPMFQIKASKPITFSATLDAEDVPTKSSVSIPDLSITAGGNSGELTGFKYNVDFLSGGPKSAMNNTVKFDVMKQKSDVPGQPNLRLGPLNLRLNITGMNPQELAALRSEGAMAIKKIQNKPGVTLSIPKSTLKTNFGKFEIDGKVKTVKSKGPSHLKGSFDLQVPFSPKTRKIFGPKFTAMVKAMIGRKLVKKSRGHVKTKLVLEEGDMKLNGKSIRRHAQALSAIMDADADQMPGMKKSKRTKKSKLLSKERKGGKKKRLRKRQIKTKTAH